MASIHSYDEWSTLREVIVGTAANYTSHDRDLDEVLLGGVGDSWRTTADFLRAASAQPFGPCSS